MKISHVIPSIEIESGGPARSSTNLIKSLLKINKELSIILFTLRTNSKPIITSFKNKNANIFFCNQSFLGFSIILENKLNSNFPDIYHGHSIWSLVIFQMSKNEKKKSIEFYIFG